MTEKRGCFGSFFAAHRGLAVLLVVETLCLLVLLARCFKPLRTQQLDLAQLTLGSAQENCTYSVQDGTLIIETTGAAGTEEEKTTLLTLTSPVMILPSDAYEVTVDYDSNQWRLDEEPVVLDFLNQGMGGVLTGGTDTWGGVYLLTLDGAHNSVTGRIWVKPGNTKGFVVRMRALALTRTEIHRITFTAKRAYRAIQMLAALLLFMALDFVLLLFFVDVGSEKTVHWDSRKKTRLVLAAICLAACLPYTAGIEYVGWDFQFHLERIAQVADELRYGQFPVRMMTGMLNGYGYANSLYYCDLFLYLPAILYNCMVPLGICYNIYGVAVAVCTCGLTYYSLHKIGSARAACVGTAVYLLSGYRLINVFFRSAVGEYTAMAFLPLVAVHVYLLYVKEELTWHEWVPLAIGMAGMVQCHILTFELTCLTLGVFAVIFWRRTFSKKRLLVLLKAAGTAVGLCAWFLVPFLQSMLTQGVHVNDIYTDSFQENGTTLLALLNPFPTSVLWSLEQELLQNCEVVVYLTILHSMQGTLGAPLLAGVVLVLYVLLGYKKWDGSKKRVSLRVMLAISGILMLFSLRQFPWNTLFTIFENTTIHKFLGASQFPWRWLSIAAVLLSASTVLALDAFGQWKKDKVKTISVVLLTTCLLYAGSFYVYFMATPEKLTCNATNADSMMIGNGEYTLPGGYDFNYARPRTENDDLKVKYYDKSNGIAHATLENIGTQEATLILPIYDYGNYVVTDDTGVVWTTKKNEESLLEISVPAGFAGSITVCYKEPVFWRVTEFSSAATLVALVLGCYTQKRKDASAKTKKG